MHSLFHNSTVKIVGVRKTVRTAHGLKVPVQISGKTNA